MMMIYPKSLETLASQAHLDSALGEYAVYEDRFFSAFKGEPRQARPCPNEGKTLASTSAEHAVTFPVQMAWNGALRTHTLPTRQLESEPWCSSHVS